MESTNRADMTRSEIAAKVIEILAGVKRLPAESIAPDASLESLGIDSLDKINVLFELEGAFDISIPDEAAASIRSVNEIVDRLAQLLPQAVD